MHAATKRVTRAAARSSDGDVFWFQFVIVVLGGSYREQNGSIAWSGARV